MATGRIPTTANSPLTVKGDLFGYSTTQARVPVGNDGETLVADSSASTGLSYQANFAAGKNKIINGAFNVWQRGTSFSTVGVNYCADRFVNNNGSMTGFSATQQTFTPGAAPVAGYEGQYYIDLAGTLSSATTGYNQFEQRIEDVRTFAGQTVTFSFWAKGSTSGTINSLFVQSFGTGGSGDVLSTPVNFSITTSWVRYTQTIAIPSVSGKTIGTSSTLKVMIVKNMGTSYPTYGTANYTGTLSLWGLQLEAGSTATAFQTATGTIQGELAACQRYYLRTNFSGGNYQAIGIGSTLTTTILDVPYVLKNTMRIAPTVIDSSTITAYTTLNGAFTGGTLTLNASNTDFAMIRYTHGSAVFTNNTFGWFYSASSGYIGVSAEL